MLTRVVLTFVLATVALGKVQVNSKGKNPSDISLVKMGEQAMVKVQELFAQNSTWTELQKDEISGVTVFKIPFTAPNGNQDTAFASQYISTASPLSFFRDLFLDIEPTSDNHPLLVSAKTVHKADPRTKVMHYVSTAETPVKLPAEDMMFVMRGGLFPFHNGKAYLLAYEGVDYTSPTVLRRKEQAQTFPSGYVIEAHGTGSKVTWIHNVEFYNSDKVPKALQLLYQGFNLILYSESMKNNIEAKYP